MSVNKKLVDKSVESILLAIELYNKPLITYRTDSVLVLIINSWESALKALILKKRWAKITVNKKKDFLECVECVKSNLGNNYPDDWYHSLIFLYEERCKIIHYNKDLVLIDYMLLQANIILFKQFLEKLLDTNMTKKVNWMILPIGFDLPYTQFDFLNTKSSIKSTSNEIKTYYEKIIEIHNVQFKKGLNGILLSVIVSMQNVNKVKNSDLVMGIKKGSEQNFTFENSIMLSSNGKEVRIKEVSETLSTYGLHYKDVLNHVKKWPGHSQKKLTNFMNNIGKKRDDLAFNWGKFSDIFPMKITNKFTYSEKFLNEYSQFLNK